MATNKACLPTAVKLLAARDHSEHELRAKLVRRYDEAEIDAALATLRSRGYLDDAALAARLAAQLLESGQYGLRGIEDRLLRRGFPTAVVETAVSAFPESDEYPRAAALARRHFPAAGRDDIPKVARFLASRGFAAETVLLVLEKVYRFAENG